MKISIKWLVDWSCMIARVVGRDVESHLVMGCVNRGLSIVSSCLGYVWADFSKPSRVVAQAR